MAGKGLYANIHAKRKRGGYKLMKGAYKPHTGAVKMAKFSIQKRHG